MGDIIRSKSIRRVLDKYGPSIKRDLRREYPTKLIKRFHLENGISEISVHALLTDGTCLVLQPYGIEYLAEKYPDCKVEY